MKLGRVVFFGIMVVVFLKFFVGISFSRVNTPPCNDGTPYYNCSVKNPGYLCLASGLVFDDRPNGCCSKVGGTIQNGECVIKCPDGTLHGQCSTSEQYGAPYYCNLGKLEKDPNKCPCPENYDRKGNDCVLKSGCAYNNPPCRYDQVCNKITNQCIDICDKNTEVYNNRTGKCDPKEVPRNQTQGGTQQQNTNQGNQQTQQQQTTNISAILGEVGTVNQNQGNTSNTKGSTVSCCVPALILLGIALLAYRVKT
ncbi:MAG: hypothetical protein N3E37_01915 [Candidatus Micrarchaeota archaeon]|nr:hypothetical protein [Candidatus Micrarchaeota archaeon]